MKCEESKRFSKASHVDFRRDDNDGTPNTYASKQGQSYERDLISKPVKSALKQ